MEVSRRPRAIRTCMNIIAFSALALFFIGKYCHSYYTSDEYVDALHRHDSIMIARKTPSLAKNHVSKCIKNTKNIKGWIKDYFYDHNEEAYVVKYRYVENCYIYPDSHVNGYDIKNVKVWLRFNLEINDGNYNIKIKKIKSEKTVDRNDKSWIDMRNIDYEKDQ